MTVPIVHDSNAMEFFTDIEGQRALLQYRVAAGVMTIIHTEVPVSLSRRGIAAELTRTAVEFARAQHWQVEPACSYARAFLQKHSEYAALVKPPAATQGENDRQHTDALLDEALEESFPASDVPAVGRDFR